MTIAYDARPLQPVTRHWGVGVVLDQLLPRLRRNFQLSGIAHRFPGAEQEGITTWPRVPKVNNFAFEVSPALVKDFDVYWGTNDFIPALSSRPSLVTVHDLLLLKYPSDQALTRFLAWRFTSSLRRATRVIAASRATADDLILIFPDVARKLEVVHWGLNITPNPESNLDSANALNGQPFVLMLGAHRPRKNLGLALNAVGRLRERGTKLSLVITGDVHPSLQNLVAASRDFVVQAGVLPRAQLDGFLRRASAVLFPSVYEGFGFPMLEAMAAGCPVLALDTLLNREIGGEAAWLLADDPEKWAAALHEIVHAPATANELREKGFGNLPRFSWDNTAKVYGDLFHHLGANCHN